jgi:hypothetical protein
MTQAVESRLASNPFVGGSGSAEGAEKVPAPRDGLKLAARLGAFAAVLIAALAIVSTARVFSATVDEPAHLAAGVQRLSTGHAGYDLQHPPLGRIFIGLGPYLHGARTFGAAGVFDEGAKLLGTGQHFVDTLASARHGVLVFFLLLAGAVWLWSRRRTGEMGALVATLLLVTNPTVLAHAGLATTDMACAATTVLALLAASWWMDRSTLFSATVFGLAAGLAIGSRLSALAFVGGPLVAAYLVRCWAERRWTIDSADRRPLWLQISAGLVAAVAVLAVLYGFDLGPLITGFRIFFEHGGGGHPAFLLGTPGLKGWWYYYPVALLVKTPPPLMLLGIVGAAAVLRGLRDKRDWRAATPLISALAILAVSLNVKVDIGVRLVLPIYPLLAIVGAQGVAELYRQSTRVTAHVATVVLLAASVLIVVRAHPDHLAYFNALAGDHPEHVLVDSNLDWGQDLYRLRDTLAARGVTDSVRIAYFGSMDPEASGVPKSRVLFFGEHPTGWIAASETYLAGEWTGKEYTWLLAYPAAARIGPSMRLWYFPPGTSTGTTRESSRR